MSRAGILRVKYICLNVLCVFLLFFFSVRVFADAVYTPVEAVIQVFCLEINGNADCVYKVAIEPGNDNAPVPESETIVVQNGGIGEFKIRMTEPGTYVYKIYELAGSDGEIIYDDTVYYVTVFVTHSDEEGLKYSVSAAASDSTGKPDTVEFSNSAESSRQPSNPLTGDFGKVVFWTVLMLLAAAVIVLLIGCGKHEKEEKN